MLGYEIDDRVARDLSRVAASEVAFRYGDSIVRSTLKPAQETELLRVAPRTTAGGPPQGDLIRLGEERFLASAVDLPAPDAPALNLWVLKSFDRATAFLSSLNELLLGLGLTAVLAGSLLVFLISHTFTRPLERAGAGGLRVSAAGAGRRRSRRGHENLRPDENESAEDTKRVAGCGTAGNHRADGEFDLA